MINASHTTKILWAKLKSSFTKEGRHEKEEDKNSLLNTSNVDEEYKQAFRTKSYIEIRNKVQCQLEISCDLDEGQSLSSSSSSIHYIHLCEVLLEPHQESLMSSNLHQFFANYFEISHEASRTCETLLTNIHQVRDNHRSFKNVIAIIQQVPDCSDWTYDQYNAMYKNISSFASQRNPFSKLGPQNFQELHNSHILLLHYLRSQCKKSKRKAKLIRVFKRATVGFLVIGFGALAIALIVLTMHFTMSLVAAPGLGIWALGHFMKKRAGRKCKGKWLNGLVTKLDIASRGVFTMMNDFETMSRIVKRLSDETERGKFVADICVRRLWKNRMLKEMVMEFQMHESCFMEQLEELEKQIYLCFLDINRSRRLLVREMAKW